MKKKERKKFIVPFRLIAPKLGIRLTYLLYVLYHYDQYRRPTKYDSWWDQPIFKLAKATGIKEREVKTCLVLLKNLGLIEFEKGTTLKLKDFDSLEKLNTFYFKVNRPLFRKFCNKVIKKDFYYYQITKEMLNDELKELIQ